MMRYLIIIALLLLSVVANSQIKFNYTYENMTWSTGRNVFALADTGYAIVGGAEMIDGKLNIGILITNNLGNEFYVKNYGEDEYNYYHGAENACIKTENGYILAGSKSGSLDTNMVYLVKFNEQFDTLWTKQFFKDTNWVTSRGICNTDDGGFLIVGETILKSDSTLGDGHHYGLMLKVDANGNYEWFKSFGTEEHHENLYKAVQTHDGGYLVGGGTESWQDGLGAIDKGDWYIVKTDSQGNEQWHRRYGNPEYDDDRISQILRATDTTYYITGAWTYDRNSTGSYKYRDSYIVKLDKNFDEVYQLKYDNQEYWKSYIMAAIETADSNILLAGVRSDDEDTYQYLPRTTLTKMTPDGDIIWQRQYVAEHDTIYGDHKGYSVKQCTDGGYVIGGWVNNTNFSPTQQLWLVKTDSVGCDGTGDFWDCSTGLMVNEFVDNPNFEMYPNPAQDYVVVRSEELQVESCEIFDLTGKVVHQFEIQNSEQRIYIGDLERGVYIVRLGKQIKKLIVE